MIVLYSGSIKVQDSETVYKAVNAIVYQNSPDADEELRITIQEAETKFILLAGKPLNEPIANYGPFVLNTAE